MDSVGSQVAAEDQFYLNGVDALTGGPLRDAQSVEQVVTWARAEFEGTPRQERTDLKTLSDLKLTPHYGMDVINLSDPAVGRWGVIFAEGEDPAIRQAL